MGKFYLTIRYLHYFKDKNDAEDISEGQKQLELSQKAWLAYREAQCEGLMGLRVLWFTSSRCWICTDPAFLYK